MIGKFLVKRMKNDCKKPTHAPPPKPKNTRIMDPLDVKDQVNKGNLKFEVQGDKIYCMDQVEGPGGKVVFTTKICVGVVENV